MDVLRSLELFIYKWQLPPNRPHPQTAALPQTGTRFLVDREVLDIFSGTWKKNWIKKREISWFEVLKTKKNNNKKKQKSELVVDLSLRAGS